VEHFSAIQSLCRVALETGDDRVRQQVKRLRDRLQKSDQTTEVRALDRLLSGGGEKTSLAPSVVEISRSLVQGDVLTENVQVPVDRETSIPLAEIILSPAQNYPVPIYSERLTSAFDDLLGEWERAAALKALGVEPSRSCLIYGPPGSGKTLTALTLARRLNLPVVNARIDGLVSSLLGTTARNIANLFDFANRYRCILLLDEFDAVAKLRDDPNELGEIKRVVNTLLQNLDARAKIGLTIAITNHEALLDKAVWRRFENQISIGLPDVNSRLEMMRAFLSPLEVDADLAKTLAFVVGARSGADLKTFADSLKRSLALADKEITPLTIIGATRGLLPRLGLVDAEGSPAKLLLEDQSAFVGAAVHTSGLNIKQESLAEMLGCSQSKISRDAAEWSAT
jgi:ATPase family associated with various cellular activities (AAA)